MLTEQLPADLGRSPRFLVERLAERGDRGAALPGARPPPGPARARPAAAAAGRPVRARRARARVGADTAPLLVVPRVRPLGAGGPAGGHGGGGEGARRTIAVHGEDDVSTREYRHGDDLRKVHWRATARTGELMVRLEERPWRAQATLFLDTRSRAHLIAAHRPGRDAALAVDRPRRGRLPTPRQPRVAGGGRGQHRLGARRTRRGPAHGHRRRRARAAVRPRPAQRARTCWTGWPPWAPRASPGLAVGVEQLCRAAGDGPVICLLGAVGPRRRGRASSGAARDPPSTPRCSPTSRAGRRPGPPGAARDLTSASRGVLARQRDDAAALLRQAGWRVAVARADRSVAEVWAELGGPAAASGASPAAAARVASTAAAGLPGALG